ncbi:hypothetical protein C2857_007885 [Epichloe festucae Fl1]|uniref:Haloacid dehalogenase n=1 Tax=Epichloe festucae (strain Fl1) TaxID=877507 RepID=A0A7S9KN64_EPIFF|nr:hypothetical protein C2857_007885 [Epichloe festucae Fl1]
MPKRNLLLCFDAFGTLFWPKPTVAQQYGQVARQCGMAAGWTQAELQSHLAAAIQDEAKVHPNYGKASGLGPTQWWTNVIYKTFQPFARHQPLPADLAPTLLQRFSSSRGYHVEQDLVTTLKRLKKQERSNMAFDRIVIGVVTNSDDRVPSVLSSFGLSVSPLRYGTHDKLPFDGGQPYDIDFTCMSYDTGYGKPHAGMFRAAEHLLTQVVAAGDIQTVSEADLDPDSWQKLHVGDEDAKDVVGALNAGWNPVLLDQDGKSAEMPSLEEQSNQPISGVFQRHSTVRVQSIRNLVSWLLGETDRDRHCEA